MELRVVKKMWKKLGCSDWVANTCPLMLGIANEYIYIYIYTYTDTDTDTFTYMCMNIQYIYDIATKCYKYRGLYDGPSEYNQVTHGFP